MADKHMDVVAMGELAVVHGIYRSSQLAAHDPKTHDINYLPQ